MKYDLKRPCEHCPFRTDIHGYLSESKALHIALAVMNSLTFACHLTTESDSDGYDLVATDNSQHCAGALIFALHTGASGWGTWLIKDLMEAGRLDISKLDMSAPVCKDINELLTIHSIRR